MMYEPKIATIASISDVAPDVKSFKLAIKIKSMPGQFLMVGNYGYGEAPFGVSSYAKPYTEICVRKVGNLTNHMHTLRKGNTLTVRGPFGHGYPLEHLHKRDIVIVGGGTGIVPLKSVIEYLYFYKENYHDISIFLGFRNPDGIIYKEEISHWEKKFNLGLTVNEKDKKWKGNIGLITDLLKNANLNKNSYILTCGPPVMINAVIDVLKAKGISERQIYVSLERLMNCGIGKCGHCLIKGKYVCKHGPVFNYAEAKELVD